MDWKANTAYSGGQEAGSEGAFCVSNLNDTDGDGLVDASDNVVSFNASDRNEVDLLKIEITNISPNERYDPSKTPIIVSNNSDIDIAAYTSPVKNSLDKITFPHTLPADANFPYNLYVEAKEHSQNMRDIKITVSKLNQSNQLVATAVWVDNIAMHHHSSTKTPSQWGVGNLVTIGMNANQGVDGRYLGQGLMSQGNAYSAQSDLKYGSRMLGEWQIKPNCTSCLELKQHLVFDGTRQRDTKNWNVQHDQCDFSEGAKVKSWPTGIEETNDDSDDGDTNRTDDPSSDLKIFTWDSPGARRDLMYLNPGERQNRAFAIDRTNFYEWVRIAIKPDQSTGSPADKYYFNCPTTVESCVAQGSRASLRKPWHFRYNVRRDDEFLLSEDNEAASDAQFLFNNPWDMDIHDKVEVQVLSANGPHEINSLQIWFDGTPTILDPQGLTKDVHFLLIAPGLCGDITNVATSVTIPRSQKEYQVENGGINIRIKELVPFDYSNQMPDYINGHIHISQNKLSTIGEGHTDSLR